MNVSKDSNDEEMITMLEEMQDQIEDMEDQLREARDDSSRAQEEISKLSSENSLLRSELQRKSEIIVSQNEKIGMLQKSDQALEENLRLRKSNSVLKEQNSRIKKEAEAEVAAAKQKAADTLAALSDREKRILEDEASLRQRETAFDKEVRSYAQTKISEESNQIKVHYGASVKQISDNYNKRLVGYQGVMGLSVIYGIVVTFVVAVKNKVLTADFFTALKTLKSIVMTLFDWIIKTAELVANYSDAIPQPIIAAVIHGILLVIVTAVLTGLCFLVLFIPLVKYTGYFKEKQADEISLLAALMALALVVFAGEEVKTILSVNLLLLMLIVFAVYSLFRGIIQMENDNVRNELLKVGGIALVTITAMVVMVHFFGIAGIVAVPIGALMAGGRR